MREILCATDRPCVVLFVNVRTLIIFDEVTGRGHINSKEQPHTKIDMACKPLLRELKVLLFNRSAILHVKKYSRAGHNKLTVLINVVRNHSRVFNFAVLAKYFISCFAINSHTQHVLL
jgi:hypothetical protein